MNQGVGVLIFNKDNKVLICKRAEETGYGQWCFVGGGVESGENAEAAIVREAKEEVGLELINVVPIDFYAKNGRLESTFICYEYNGEITIQETEISEVKWVSLDEIESFELFEPSKISLDIYRKYLKRSNT